MTASSVARFLDATELKALVCKHVESGRTLCSLALTCKALLDPCLDAIWFEINSFRPLLSCVPKESWTMIQTGPDMIPPQKAPRVIISTRKFTSDDLERYLKHYAPRIRIFKLVLDPHPTGVSLELMKGLREATGWAEPGCLAPFLKKFDWDLPVSLISTNPAELYGCAVWVHLPFAMDLFLPSSTLVEYFGAFVTSEDGQRMLEAASRRLPRVKTLVHLAPLPDATYYIMSNKWLHLETLKIASLGVDAVPHLAALPRLANLEVKLIDKGQHIQPPMNDIGQSFTLLRNLDIHTFGGFGPTIAFFRYLLPTNGVRKLTCTTSRGTICDEAKQLLATLQAHFNPRALKKIDVQDNFLPPQNRGRMVGVRPGHHASTIDISPISNFTGLEKLILRFEPQVTMNTSDITLIPSSWPRMKHIDLRGTLPLDNEQPPTIDHTHIFGLLEKLPVIRFLGIPFNAANIPPGSVSPHAPFALEKLRVCGSPIVSCSRVTRFLQQNFPNLKKCSGRYQDWLIWDRPWDALWEEVAEAWQ